MISGVVGGVRVAERSPVAAFAANRRAPSSYLTREVTYAGVRRLEGVADRRRSVTTGVRDEQGSKSRSAASSAAMYASTTGRICASWSWTGSTMDVEPHGRLPRTRHRQPGRAPTARSAVETRCEAESRWCS